MFNNKLHGIIDYRRELDNVALFTLQVHTEVKGIVVIHKLYRALRK